MPERIRFDIVENHSNLDKNSLDLELGERMDIPFTGGEIIYATTKSGEKVVIKKTLNDDQAKREWTGLNTAYSTAISVPRPIALINYSVDHLGIVSTYIDGDNLYYDPNPEVKFEIGRQMRTMHQKAKVEGKIWESSGRNSFVYYDRYISKWTSASLEELKLGSTTDTLLTKLSDVAEQLCKNSKPTFNHNDLHDGQIIIDANGTPTIIDFGNWTEETWLNDIGYHLFHLIRINRSDTSDFKNFLDGYLENKKLSDTEKSELAFYLLFISSRALNYFYRNQNPYLSVAQDTHKRILAHIEDEIIWKNY